MTAPKVKICGLQSIDTLESMSELQVDYIGFIFAKSKRQVSPKQAGKMIDYIKKKMTGNPLTVGVFVNPTMDELVHTLKDAPLDVIQLHGMESSELCGWVQKHLKVKVFKVFAIMNELSDAEINQALDPYQGTIDALMLDTYDPVVGGGTGKTFAWERIPSYQRWAHLHDCPLIIAGGLETHNVAELIAVYRPDGVDVSSGVEIDGMKDIHKITAFVERVKNP